MVTKGWFILWCWQSTWKLDVENLPSEAIALVTASHAVIELEEAKSQSWSPTVLWQRNKVNFISASNPTHVLNQSVTRSNSIIFGTMREGVLLLNIKGKQNQERKHRAWRSQQKTIESQQGSKRGPRRHKNERRQGPRWSRREEKRQRKAKRRLLKSKPGLGLLSCEALAWHVRHPRLNPYYCPPPNETVNLEFHWGCFLDYRDSSVDKALAMKTSRPEFGSPVPT